MFHLLVAASQDPKTRPDAATVSPFSLLENLWEKCGPLANRYDFVSAGLGALAVTTFCVSRGQDPGTALWITAASTVVALLVNDMFGDGA